MWICCFWFQEQCTGQASPEIQVPESDMDLSSLRHQKSSKGFVFTPVCNKNSFVILEICLPDWKDFSCACCLWSYVSQCNYNIALMLSWSLLFWTAKHKSIHVALFPAGSESWALLSALKPSTVWRTGGWWVFGWHFWDMQHARSCVYISPCCGSKLLWEQTVMFQVLSESPVPRTGASESGLCHKTVYHDHECTCCLW